MSDSDEDYSEVGDLMSEFESDDSDCDSESHYYIFVRNSKDSEWESVGNDSRLLYPGRSSGSSQTTQRR